MSEVLNEIITLNQFGLSRSFREALGGIIIRILWKWNFIEGAMLSKMYKIG